MQKIVFETQPKKVIKTKRHSVIVNDENYLKIREINYTTGIPVERIVDLG